jgi:hypothetical protein
MTDTTAFASLSGSTTTICVPKGCGPELSDTAYVNVDRGMHTFKPKDGAKVIQQSGTMLTLELIINGGSSHVSGGWIIAHGDFVVAGDLSSATLSTTVWLINYAPRVSPLAVSSGPSFSLVAPASTSGESGLTCVPSTGETPRINRDYGTELFGGGATGTIRPSTSPRMPTSGFEGGPGYVHSVHGQPR